MMAEELRRRGVFKKSEELFLKALNLNPLDYRIYVGLAETYLQMNEFDKAKTFLKDSIPHAPESYYIAYSYRLIAHIHFCEEDYFHAVAVAQMAIERSPSYQDAQYDYAQYSALVGEKKGCLVSLQKLISTEPRYFYLAQSESNFDALRGEVEYLLQKHKAQVMHEAQEAIDGTEWALQEAQASMSATEQAMRK
jgi:tetratricopeptide (TPR) repeat protein